MHFLPPLINSDAPTLLSCAKCRVNGEPRQALVYRDIAFAFDHLRAMAMSPEARISYIRKFAESVAHMAEQQLQTGSYQEIFDLVAYLLHEEIARLYGERLEERLWPRLHPPSSVRPSIGSNLPKTPITDAEVADFLRIDLVLIDKSWYFEKHFGGD